MKKKSFQPVSKECLFRHFLPEQRKKKELNPEEFPEESEECDNVPNLVMGQVV